MNEAYRIFAAHTKAAAVSIHRGISPGAFDSRLQGVVRSRASGNSKMADAIDTTGIEDQKLRLEKQKFRLELLKSVVSAVALGSILLGVYQLYETQKSTELNARMALINTYDKVIQRWGEHLRDVARQPDIMPFFADKRPLPEEPELRSKVLAFADVRLDTADAVLTLLRMYGAKEEEVQGWYHTFALAFARSPVLCRRYLGDRHSYGLLQRTGDAVCSELKDD